MNTEAHDKLSQGALLLRSAAARVRDHAHALQDVGLDRMASKLFADAADLDRAHVDIVAGIGEAVASYVRQSGEATTNMVMAAIAGVTYGASHQPE